MDNVIYIDHQLYFGKWTQGTQGKRADIQGAVCIFNFKGDYVKVSAIKGPDMGYCSIYIDDRFEGQIDCYDNATSSTIIFEAHGVNGDTVHRINILSTNGKNPASSGCNLEITGFEAAEPVNYPDDLRQQMEKEYEQIISSKRPGSDPQTWKAVRYNALMPRHGVQLLESDVKRLFDKNIKHIKYCFSIPYYCEGNPFPFTKPLSQGRGWANWLPGSNDARLLAGAANALKWIDDPELRSIMDKIVTESKMRMREDGYNNYYPEEYSYAISWKQIQDIKSDNFPPDFVYSERKNYDRVFWTRGMIAAHEAGNPDALKIARKMYDWFNQAYNYLPTMLLGANATNGAPGGPLMYHTELGKPEDIITNQRYFDQEYWMRAFIERQPLSLSHFPGDRPHCYDLLVFETIADEYRATGDRKYLEALLGAWDIYFKNYIHIGGITAICESTGPYPPKSYYLTTGHNGETCGSVFWIWVNSKLMQLFPGSEKYPNEIERSIFNAILNCRTEKQGTRYHSQMQGRKDKGNFDNTCCEVSSTMLISSLPQYIYMTNGKEIYINLFIASEFDAGGIRLHMESIFPRSMAVRISIIAEEGENAANINIRVPFWACSEMPVYVNGELVQIGKPAHYVSLERSWKNGDNITFTLPAKFELKKYTGCDQVGPDRYALLYGPILMALTGEGVSEDTVPWIHADPRRFIESLMADNTENPLELSIQDMPGMRYVPYIEISDEPFNCYPIIEK